MKSTRLGRTRTAHTASLVALAGLVWACAEGGITDTLTSSPERAAQTAKGGNGGGPDKDPTVTEVDPDTVPQDTTIDLTVKGRDFDDGSVAEFGIDGVVTEEVKTNSTTFVDSKTLVANVTVALDAIVGDYDALVTTKRGRKGVGTEKLHIVLKGKPPEIPISLLSSGGVQLSRERSVSRDVMDSDRQLIVASSKNDPGAGTVTTAFANSRAVFGPCSNGSCGQCVVDPPDLDQATADAMAAEFELARTPAGVSAYINLRSLQAAGDTKSDRKHETGSGHDSPAFGGANVLVHVRRSGIFPQAGNPEVELVEKDVPIGGGRTRTVYRFNAGSGAVRVWVRANLGGAPNGPILACPLLDDVTVAALEGPFPGP